ncbi:MAG: hypothetical protein Q8O83_02945 [bacterium]|nr:hypothetical protein [bacterium]
MSTDSIPTQKSAQKLTYSIVQVLWEYVKNEGFGWTPEKLRESLGDDSVAIGNFLLNAEAPMTNNEIADALDLPVERLHKGMDVLKGWYGAIKFIGGVKGREITYTLKPMVSS